MMPIVAVAPQARPARQNISSFVTPSSSCEFDAHGTVRGLWLPHKGATVSVSGLYGNGSGRGMGSVVEEWWRQPELIPVLLLLLSVPVAPSPSSPLALGSLRAWKAAALLLPGRRPLPAGPAHPGGRHTVPVGATACPPHPQHCAEQPLLLPLWLKMNWVGGSRWVKFQELPEMAPFGEMELCVSGPVSPQRPTGPWGVWQTLCPLTDWAFFRITEILK